MEDEGEEFSLVITHNTSVKSFLLLYLDLLETEFLVSKHTVEAIRTLIPAPLLETSNYYEETWSASTVVRKTKGRALENGSREVEDEIGVEAFESIKREEVQEEDICLPTWNDLDDIDEDPVNFHENNGSTIDHLIDTEVLNDEFRMPEIPIKAVTKRRTFSDTNLRCVINSCEMGNHTFRTPKELKIHQKEKHANLYCLKCNAVSNSEEDLLTHNCSKRYKCKQCQRLFSTNHELKSHSYIHSGEKPHMCDHCGKGFRQRATLDRHKLTHESKRNYDCDICHKKFKFKHYLVSHKLLHTGVKPHMCTWCGLKFAQNANMQKHIRQQHTHEKSHVCKYCGKGFVQPYYLRRHMSCHKEAEAEKATLDILVESHTSSDEQTGIRTYSCIFCSVTCKGHLELEKHIVKHHQDMLNRTESMKHEEENGLIGTRTPEHNTS